VAIYKVDSLIVYLWLWAFRCNRAYFCKRLLRGCDFASARPLLQKDKLDHALIQYYFQKHLAYF